MDEPMNPHVFEPSGHSVFPVENDDVLGRLIALFLHNRLFGSKPKRGDKSLEQLGWQDSLVNEMSSMPLQDVTKILSGPNACLGVVFDHRKAAAVLNSYRAIKRDADDLDFFILNGATPALMRRLFPHIRVRVIAEHRKRLGCETRGGRPPLPDPEAAHAIYRCWESLCKLESDPRCRYRRLKELFPSLSFATLFAAIEPS